MGKTEFFFYFATEGEADSASDVVCDILAGILDKEDRWCLHIYNVDEAGDTVDPFTLRLTFDPCLSPRDLYAMDARFAALAGYDGWKKEN